MGDMDKAEEDVVFCKCGRVARLGKFCSEKCRTKKPRQPKKAKWSGYSRFRAKGGYNAE